MQVKSMEWFELRADEHGIIHWFAPDGKTYQLNPDNPAEPDKWLLTHNTQGKPVMGLKVSANKDAVLIVSLEGAKGHATTLLHYEDDVPRQYYLATDGGNSDNPLNCWAFKLSTVGFKKSPVPAHAILRVLCVG